MQVSNGHTLSLWRFVGRQGPWNEPQNPIKINNPSINSINAESLANRYHQAQALHSSIDITSHHVRSTTPVQRAPRAPLNHAWPGASRKRPRAYLPETFPNPIRRMIKPSHRFEAAHQCTRTPSPSAANESRVPAAGSAPPRHEPRTTHTCPARRLFPWGQDMLDSQVPAAYGQVSSRPFVVSRSRRRRRRRRPPEISPATMTSSCRLGSRPQSLPPQSPNHAVHQPQVLRFALLPAPDSKCPTCRIVSV